MMKVKVKPPKYNKSHLALYWVGKGRIRPVIILRKGSLIRP
jgi:hypothetical protein